jgi:hypothetical protein
MSEPQDSKKYAHEIGKRFIEIQKEIAITELKEGVVAKSSEVKASSKDYFAINWIGLDKSQYYVRLGYFLEFLYTRIIPTVDSNNIVKSLNIDYDPLTNIIYTLPQQISSDPKVCIFKAPYTTANGIFTLFQFIDSQSDFIRSDNFEANYGLIMNAFFNMDYILDGIENNKDEKGKISLYSILNLLCQGWNSSTGNYNNLEPVIDSETNTIKLVDSVALPDRDDLLKELNISTEIAFFDIFRYGTYPTNDKNNPNIPHAGFIKDLSFNTTVGSNMATMITVGATANGYVVGEDATALSRMNAGLTDRFKDIIGYPEDENTSTTVLGTAEQTLEVRYQAAITSFDYYVDKLSKYEWVQGAIDDFSSLQTQLLEYEQAHQVQIAAKDYITKDSTIDQSTLPASANGGFLPFDLSLTMDGMSGMKIYQKFSADTNFLPTNYPNSLEFIIKGITHTISDNQWTTNIESFAIPLNPFSATGSLRNSGGGGDSGGSSTNNYPTLSTYSNIDFSNRVKNDRINPNLLADINKAAINAGVKVTITTAISGHRSTTKSGNISRHTTGNGIDIAIINGVGSGGATNATNGNATFRTDGNKLKDALVALGYKLNVESGQTKAVLWQSNAGGVNHFNHLHVSRKN